MSRTFLVTLHFPLMEQVLNLEMVDESKGLFGLRKVRKHTLQLRKSERYVLKTALDPFWKFEIFIIVSFLYCSLFLSFFRIRSFIIVLFWHLIFLIHQ